MLSRVQDVTMTGQATETFKAHVVVPTREDIEKLLVDQRKKVRGQQQWDDILANPNPLSDPAATVHESRANDARGPDSATSRPSLVVYHEIFIQIKRIKLC